MNIKNLLRIYNNVKNILVESFRYPNYESLIDLERGEVISRYKKNNREIL